eukprot:CAMPEP_0194559660 /NCGR_PEP_ID=MMETSP0292-20121207/1131_1 /TAXON_ID=39354 /ORGANISM="Heterosigma akashiwo, Strain CCMP2393" /LENGTH=55 /DNA_ID=CAMNT_0039407643 /DNA_START=121 /DNA_END=288 /DNA_ORIENTATION=+
MPAPSAPGVPSAAAAATASSSGTAGPSSTAGFRDFFRLGNLSRRFLECTGPMLES